MNSVLYDIVNAPLDELLNAAEQEYRAQDGEIQFCGIINVKNGLCSMDCRFCAQSLHYKTSSQTFPLLSSKHLVNATHQLWNQGISHVGWVASGCSPTIQELDTLVSAVEIIFSADKTPPKQLCASLGQLESPALQRLKSAGLARYHHNLETSHRFYASLCSTQRWEDRRATVESAKNIGLSVCSGGLFGLGETWQDRWELASELEKLNVDSVPINFFNPIVGTPLAERPILTMEEALRIVVLFRRILSKADIRICGGRPLIFPDRTQDQQLIRAGADAFMTGNYLTTQGISPETDRQRLRKNRF